jgi:hypothetical protein
LASSQVSCFGGEPVVVVWVGRIALEVIVPRRFLAGWLFAFVIFRLAMWNVAGRWQEKSQQGWSEIGTRTLTSPAKQAPHFEITLLVIILNFARRWVANRHLLGDCAGQFVTEEILFLNCFRITSHGQSFQSSI